MLGLAATLDHVRPGVSQIKNASGTLYGGVRGQWQSKHKAISFCSVPSPDWLRGSFCGGLQAA